MKRIFLAYLGGVALCLVAFVVKALPVYPPNNDITYKFRQIPLSAQHLQMPKTISRWLPESCQASLSRYPIKRLIPLSDTTGFVNAWNPFTHRLDPFYYYFDNQGNAHFLAVPAPAGYESRQILVEHQMVDGQPQGLAVLGQEQGCPLHAATTSVSGNETFSPVLTSQLIADCNTMFLNEHCFFPEELHSTRFVGVYNAVSELSGHPPALAMMYISKDTPPKTQFGFYSPGNINRPYLVNQLTATDWRSYTSTEAFEYAGTYNNLLVNYMRLIWHSSDESEPVENIAYKRYQFNGRNDFSDFSDRGSFLVQIPDSLKGYYFSRSFGFLYITYPFEGQLCLGKMPVNLEHYISKIPEFDHCEFKLADVSDGKTVVEYAEVYGFVNKAANDWRKLVFVELMDQGSGRRDVLVVDTVMDTVRPLRETYPDDTIWQKVHPDDSISIDNLTMTYKADADVVHYFPTFSVVSPKGAMKDPVSMHLTFSFKQVVVPPAHSGGHSSGSSTLLKLVQDATSISMFNIVLYGIYNGRIPFHWNCKKTGLCGFKKKFGLL